MKEIHRQNTDVRQHFTLSKNSADNNNAKILYAGELKKTFHWKEEMHSHSFCEIVFVKSGNGIIHTDKDTLNIKQGDLIIYNSGTAHSEASADNDGLSLWFCGVDSLNIKDKPENCILNADESPVLHTGAAGKLFERYFYDLLCEVKSRSYYYDEISNSLVNIIINLILRVISQNNMENSKSNESYQIARAFIDENYDKITDVQYICRNLHVSRSFLMSLFKEYSGISPLQYVIDKRIEKAKELLLTTDLSVSEIAKKIGYKDAANFSRLFKKEESLTPCEYRLLKV